MARKIASPAASKTSSAPRKSRAKKVAAVVTTVAALVGYDPTLLLAAPAQAVITIPAPSDSDHLAQMALDYDMAALTPPASNDILLIEAIEDAKAPSAVESFKAMFAGIEAFEVGNAMLSVGRRFSDRASYEVDKNPDNLNIHRTIRKCQSWLGSDLALRVLLTCETDESFIDRELRDGARYNVYAIDKVADLVSYLSGNVVLNRINNAVLRSMIAFDAAGVDFTMDLAKAAASDKIRVEPRYRALLTSHTVSASTAPTQASSTMQALVTLGIVESTGKGGSKNPTYRLTDSAQTKVLRERLAA